MALLSGAGLALLAALVWLGAGVARADEEPEGEIHLTAGEPRFVDVTDGVYTFLTGTDDGDVWLQVVDYEKGVANSTLLTSHGERTRPTQPVPANASVDYVPNPVLPTVIYTADDSINRIEADGQGYNPNACISSNKAIEENRAGAGAEGPPACGTQFLGTQINSANYFFPTAGVGGAVSVIIRSNPGLYPAPPDKPRQPGAADLPRPAQPKVQVGRGTVANPITVIVRGPIKGAIKIRGGVQIVDINPDVPPPAKPDVGNQPFDWRPVGDGTWVKRDRNGGVAVYDPNTGILTEWFPDGKITKTYKNGNKYTWKPRVPGPGYDVDILVVDPKQFKPK